MADSERTVIIEHYAEFRGIVNTQSRKKLWEAANLVRNNLLTTVLVGEGTGRKYKLPGTNRMYTASAPGQAPATRMGDLRRSYAILPKDPSAIENEVAVGSPLPYSVDLEKGTRKVAARPHLSTAFNNVRAEITTLLTEGWEI